MSASTNGSQFDKEAVDIKFDTVEGFLLVDRIIHRKTQTFEVRHSKYTSGTSRIGMRVSEGIPSPQASSAPPKIKSNSHG